MQKFLLVVIWLPTTFISLSLCLVLLNSYSKVKEGHKLLALEAKKMAPLNGYQFYAALPQVLGSFSQAVTSQDARPEILRQFLTKHSSPLVPYSALIVSLSDVHGVDFRLITAISGCESTFGKNMPAGSYNAFGYATYTGQTSGASFASWEQSISVMAEYLSNRYLSRGLTTPELMGPIYAPPSVNTGHSWAKCVHQFMGELS